MKLFIVKYLLIFYLFYYLIINCFSHKHVQLKTAKNVVSNGVLLLGFWAAASSFQFVFSLVFISSLRFIFLYIQLSFFYSISSHPLALNFLCVYLSFRFKFSFNEFLRFNFSDSHRRTFISYGCWFNFPNRLSRVGVFNPFLKICRSIVFVHILVLLQSFLISSRLFRVSFLFSTFWAATFPFYRTLRWDPSLAMDIGSSTWCSLIRLGISPVGFMMSDPRVVFLVVVAVLVYGVSVIVTFEVGFVYALL